MQLHFIFPRYKFITTRVNTNTLWPSDAIWRHRFGSALAQEMACCHQATSHYLNQCWHIISKVHAIHLRAISKHQPSITEIKLKTTHLKFHLNLPLVNELKIISTSTTTGTPWTLEVSSVDPRWQTGYICPLPNHKMLCGWYVSQLDA